MNKKKEQTLLATACSKVNGFKELIEKFRRSMIAKHEVMAHVLEKIWNTKGEINLNTWQIRTLDAVRRCRTASLGGYVDSCDSCGNISISYNSCRNMHCPKCN